MTEKADHPHQAAVHLVKSLKCCKECYDVSQFQYAQIGQLQFERDVLARQLQQIGEPDQDLHKVAAEVHDLEFLIQKVREENEIAYQTGLSQIDAIIQDREKFEISREEGLHMQLIAQKERYHALSLQIERQMQRIRYLHRINEELVGKFCHF